MKTGKNKYGILVITLLLSSTAWAVSDTAPTNMVVDFDSTSIDSNLRKGDSGILNLVIQNSGGRRAEDVEVYIPESRQIHAGKRFYIGRMEAGQSKNIPIAVRVDDNARTGLHGISVRISYDGYDSDDERENNLLSTWEIPVRVYGDPLFQINPVKTTYFEDNLDEVIFEGLSKDPVKDLEVTLSSSCITIIGSSRKFVGDIKEEEKFNISYEVKPSSSGACTVDLDLSYTDESSSKVSDEVSIGLNIEDAGVDFKVVNISYKPTGPGETVSVTVGLKNVGNAKAGDTTLSLSLSEPFAPVDTSEKYLGEVSGSQTVETQFDIAVGWDAETKAYSIPLNINYKIGGTSYTVEKDIGLHVSGKVILEIIKVEERSGSLRVEVANIGTRTAEGVKATLTSQGGNHSQRTTSDTQAQRSTGANPAMNLMGRRTGRMGGGQATTMGNSGAQELISYKSDIKPSKQTTFSFDSSMSGPVTLTLEYNGLNNERVTQTETFTVGGGWASFSTLGSAHGGGGTSIFTYLLYALVVLLVTWIAYRKYKKKNILPDFLKKKLKKNA